MNEYCYQQRHMGTDISLAFVCEYQSLADTVAKDTFANIHNYELIFSRFLPKSELSLLNRHGSGVVSKEFMAVLERSIELVALTKGAFNPLVQVTALGYTSTFAALKDGVNQVASIPYSTDIQLIKIEQKTQYITLGPNQQLDFGGVLKGYLADLLADNVMRLHSELGGCIINIGGDLATRGSDPFHEPFIFQLYNPVTGEETPVAITNATLVTSGTYARSWKTESGVRHHIVDSQSQQNPKGSIVAVSIRAQNGALAEALSKLFITRGITEALTVAPPKKHQYTYFAVSEEGVVDNTII